LIPSGDLSDIGFIRNGIVEVILSTFDEDHHPHAAPMGASTEDMRSIVLTPFKSSQTYGNLLKWRSGVANITSDPVLFHRTVFKDSNPGGELPQEWFTHAPTVDAPRMTNTDFCIELRVTGIEESEDRAQMLCRVEMVLMLNRSYLPHVYNRAAPAVIESIIHATRIEAHLNAGRPDKAAELITLVEHYCSLVERVAPDSTYSELMNDIQRRINLWRHIR
jgi:hypothetical protein